MILKEGQVFSDEKTRKGKRLVGGKVQVKGGGKGEMIS